MKLHRPRLAFFGLCLLLLPVPWALGAQVELQARQTWDFDPGIHFTNQFDGARVNGCEQVGPSTFRITITPENAPINPSPWFAFKAWSDKPRDVEVHLVYGRWEHRYVPKLSHDGVRWRRIAPKDLTVSGDQHEATLRLSLGPKPLWVAGEELVEPADIVHWVDAAAKHPFVKSEVFGKSLGGRDLHYITIDAGAPPRYIFLTSRQHPPEVSGELAFLTFTERLMADDPLAVAFREQFRIVAMPMLNPDGVVEGHWRHNLDGVDLNRDWGAFAQPETRAARDLMLHLAQADGASAWLLLDFHSTQHDVFYTQAEEQPTKPAGFIAPWLAAIQADVPDFLVRRTTSHQTETPTLKNWGYETFGIPSMTFELGDETPRPLIRQVANHAAEEMMHLLLKDVATVAAPVEAR